VYSHVMWVDSIVSLARTYISIDGRSILPA